MVLEMAIDRRWVYGGIAVGGGVIAFYLYRQNKKAEQKSAQAQASFAYGYGSQYAYGYGQYYEPYGYGFGPFGLGTYGGGGQYGYGYYGGGVPAPVPQQATTNAQWSEAAMSALSSAGYNPMTVLAALGKYLIGGNLTADEVTIVTAAIGAEGYPPVPGPNNYPPQMHTGGTPGGGQPPPARTAGAISNFTASNVTRTSFRVSWNAATGATKGYRLVVKQLDGKQIGGDRKTSGTSMTISGLRPGFTYNVGIQALPGGAGNNIHVTTHK
jgi:hypothetical protein